MMIADIVNKVFKKPLPNLAPEVIQFSSAQNVHKVNEDSFSRSEKEDGGGEPPKEGSPMKEENPAGGEGGAGASRSRSKEGGGDEGEKGS